MSGRRGVAPERSGPGASRRARRCFATPPRPLSWRAWRRGSTAGSRRNERRPGTRRRRRRSPTEDGVRVPERHYPVWQWLAGRRRDVERGVAVEEPERDQHEPRVLDRHHRPVLGPGYVGDAEGVPEHDVALDDGAVRRGPVGEPVPAGVLVGVVARGTPLDRVVGRHPQVARGEAGPLAPRSSPGRRAAWASNRARACTRRGSRAGCASAG